MRVIAFRGKRKDTGEWVYGDLLQTINGVMGKEACILPFEIAMTKDVIPETIGQFTGLLDCNGKRIYEGDIVTYTFIGKGYRQRKERKITYTGKVIFNNSDSGWAVENTAGKYLDIHIMAIQGWEVIGNIHDNPELLKEAE